MTICNRCGKEVESEAYGYYSDQRGFLCNSCVNLLDMTPCTECGEHFPFEEMVEWDGDMFCKKDYNELKTRSDEEDQEEAKKAAEEKKEDEEEGIIGKPSGPKEANTSEDEENADSDEISERPSSETDDDNESFLQKLSRFLGLHKDKK